MEGLLMPKIKKAASSPQPKHYYVQVEAIQEARTIAKKTGAKLSDRELNVILAVALCRETTRRRDQIDEDFESMRAGILRPLSSRSPLRLKGQPESHLEHWFKLFLRERDAVLKIMLKATEIDRKNALDPVAMKLRNEIPGEKTLNRILDEILESHPHIRPNTEAVRTQRKRLRRGSLEVEGRQN
jgi:hypothetical protein